jgi:TatA/E family protein of Tat protein translocase
VDIVWDRWPIRFLSRIGESGSYNRSGGFHVGRIGLPEMLVIFVIVLVIFGPKKLPDLARGLGQAIRGFKDAVQGGEEEPKTQPPVSDDRKAMPK